MADDIENYVVSEIPRKCFSYGDKNIMGMDWRFFIVSVMSGVNAQLVNR